MQSRRQCSAGIKAHAKDETQQENEREREKQKREDELPL